MRFSRLWPNLEGSPFYRFVKQFQLLGGMIATPLGRGKRLGCLLCRERFSELRLTALDFIPACSSGVKCSL